MAAGHSGFGTAGPIGRYGGRAGSNGLPPGAIAALGCEQRGGSDWNGARQPCAGRRAAICTLGFVLWRRRFARTSGVGDRTLTPEEARVAGFLRFCVRCTLPQPVLYRALIRTT